MKKRNYFKQSRRIDLRDKKVDYLLATSRRAKRMRLAVYCDGSFVATRPRGLSASAVEEFILKNSDWIISKIEYFRSFGRGFLSRNKNDYLKHKNQAREFISEKVERYNQYYGFKFNQINIRSQKTRWGSCSSKGNLNFNYKILFLPEKIADYIVVHELCHLKEFNHSRKFWELVAKTFPEYKELRKRLKTPCR